MSILANLLDPEVVVLGGYFVPLARWLLPAAEAELHARSVSAEDARRIVASTLGRGAAATGAAPRSSTTSTLATCPTREETPTAKGSRCPRRPPSRSSA